MRQRGLILAAGRVHSKRKKKQTKKHPTQNTPQNLQHPGDRDELETACKETRPTHSPILSHFHRSQVCENRPRTALAISKNDKCYTHLQTHIQTNEIMAPYTHPGTNLEVNEARGGLILAVGRVRSRRKKMSEKSRPIQNTPRNPQQPGDRDQLETACD